MNVFGQKLIVEYFKEKNTLRIINPSVEVNSGVLVEINLEVLEKMDFNQASEFFGARVLLLIPEIRNMFSDYLQQDE